jgi:hypothetical protein
MPEKDKLLKAPTIDIHERRITLEDGRYMVFFTFTDDAGKDLSEGLHPWTSDGSSSGERTTASGPTEPGQPPLLSATARGVAPARTPDKEGS